MFSLQSTAAHRIALHGKAMQRIAKQRGQPVSNSRLSEWFSLKGTASQGSAMQSKASQCKAKQRGKHLATGVCRVVLTHGTAKHRIEINCIDSQGNAAQRKAKRQALGFAGGFSRQRKPVSRAGRKWPEHPGCSALVRVRPPSRSLAG